MKKDFDDWNSEKKKLDGENGTALFNEREVWWCALGRNIGCEQDGGENRYDRPVVIVKKFNLDACLVVPLTAKIKTGRYYYSCGPIEDKEAVAILSQIRFVDRKRFSEKICMLNGEVYKGLLKAVVDINFTP